MSQNGCLRSCASPWTPPDQLGGKLGRSLMSRLLFQNPLSDNVGGLKRFPLFCPPVVLTFFIAGLLYLLRFKSAPITWERTASRRRPAFSSHLVT
jgi:hypothetical protein